MPLDSTQVMKLMTYSRNKTKKMQKKYQIKNSMMPIQKWTKLVTNQDYTVQLRMKIISNQFLINILLQEKIAKEIHQVLISLPKIKLMKHQWILSWNGMIYQNRMLENIWNRSSIRIGKSLMLIIKDSLIRQKLSNLKDNLWEHSLVLLMGWILLESILFQILRKLI